MPFIVGLLKKAKQLQSLAGVTDAALKRHNAKAVERMLVKKPLYSLKDIATLYPGLKLLKKAEPMLSEEAREQSSMSMQEYVPGRQLTGDAETGQFKGKNYRTQNVQNEDREMKPSLKTKAQTARGGKHYGGQVYDRFSKEDRR